MALGSVKKQPKRALAKKECAGEFRVGDDHTCARKVSTMQMSAILIP